MTFGKNRQTAGFALIELLTVISIISILASIAIPHYAVYLQKANAISCQSNRRNIEMEELSREVSDIGKRSTPNEHVHSGSSFPSGFWLFAKTLLAQASTLLPWNAAQGWAAATQSVAMQINPTWTCPSGGTYLWLVTDKTAEEYPKVGCSIHYGTVPITPSSAPNFNVPSGQNISKNGGFEDLDKMPKPGSWRMINSAKIGGWESSNNRFEVWSSGMLGVKAPEGNYFIELDTDNNKNKTDSLSQQIETEVGRVYEVRLKAQSRVAGTSDFEILWDNVSVSQISPLVGQWNDYSVKVVGTGAPINLAIAEIAGQNNGLGALLDSIEVITTDETR